MTVFKAAAPNTQKTSKSKRPLSKFDKKWQEIEKKQKRNNKLKQDISQLYQIFQDDAQPVEHQLNETIAAQIEHLAGFIKRKSLSENQRDNLMQWISGNMEMLLNNPFCPPDLVKKLQALVLEALNEWDPIDEDDEEDNFIEPASPEEIESMRSHLDAILGGKKQFSDEQLAAFVMDPCLLEDELSNFFANADQHAFNQQGADDQASDEDWDEGFHDNEPNDSRQQEKLKSLFGAAELGKIYKALANKLHPDKESDPKLKAEKAMLMGQLSKARKNKDAFTIIQMFQTHLPNKALEFDPNLMEALCTLLNQKIRTLEIEYRSIPQQAGLAGVVWHKFQSRSEKTRMNNLNRHIQMLKHEIEEIDFVMADTRTVKGIKPYLSNKPDPMTMFDPSLLPDLDDLFAHFADDFYDGETPF